MHIPDGFLGPGVATSTWIVAGGCIALALRAERREAAPMPAGILGSVAAFLFAAQMVNIPVAPGTSGHLVGSTLAAVLLGPWRALLAMAAVLAVQALLFQDGGITAFGANFLDMALAGSCVGYAAAHFVACRVRGPRGGAAGAVIGAFAATVCAAALAAVWLSLSGLYPLGGILPVMLVTHVAVGLLEAALTGAILVTLLRWRPDLVAGLDGSGVERRPAAVAVGVLGVALAVAAFLSPFASALPDGLQKTAEAMGFASRAKNLWSGPMTDYQLPWPRLAAIAPALTGAVGALAAAALAWGISRALSSRDDEAHH